MAYSQSVDRSMSFFLLPPGTTHERRRMDSDTDLKDLAREAIETGRVPQVRPERLWGSSGDGSDCPICFQAIVSEDVGFELDFPRSSSLEPPRDSCLIHARCFKAWDAVRQESALAAPIPQTGVAEAP
jgi:hypothetical protein